MAIDIDIDIHIHGSAAPALQRLLDAGRDLPPEYAQGLSSHLPMALHALAELGADEARMAQFASRYAQRFADMARAEGGAAEPLADWPASRGRADAYPGLHASFVALLARDGRAAVLRASLPLLWPGVAAAAFHGLIRTAHAVQAGHDGELAAALAYWAWRWQPLAAPPQGPPLAVADWGRRLVAAGDSVAFAGRLISQRVAAAAQSEAYAQLAGRLPAGDDVPARLWALAAARYADTRNFTVLHIVTGVRALHVLQPWADAAARAHALHAVAAAWLAAGAAVRRLPPLEPPPWRAIVQRAIAADDDHVIKLVHACLDAARRGVAGRFAEAAARALS